MTVAEVKSSILAQLNQQALSNVIDQLATLAVENEELKKRIAELTPKEAPHTD